MKIAIAIERYNPTGGGAERSTAQIADELAARGHEVTVLTACFEQDQPANLAVRAMSDESRMTGSSLRRFAAWARQHLADGGFDTSLSVTTTVPAAVVEPRSGTLQETFRRNIAMRPTALGQAFKRVTLALSPKHRTLLSLERQTLVDPMVRRFVALSGYVSRQLQEQGIDAARITCIANGSTLPIPDDDQRRQWRQTVRQGFGIADDQVAFLFAAHNPRLKGAEPLLHAMQSLSQRQLPVVLLMAGQTLYAHQRLAAELGIRERVKFVGLTGQMAQLYCAADVTVHPTFYDPSSKVVMESLMLGTPAISTRWNGASEQLVSQGVSRGRVIDDPNDVASLAGAMAELCDPDERRRCRAACAGLDTELSMSRHVDRLVQVLEQASGRASKTAAA
jgi:UDP-glucose:(heptosyl)LPS alpha-1,3-glucosyltransferase